MAEKNTEICRVTRSKGEAKAAYDRLGRWYDLIVGWSEKRARGIGLKKLNAAEDESALEIGFGTGHCLLALAQPVGDSGRVYGIDLAESMLNISNDHLKTKGEKYNAKSKGSKRHHRRPARGKQD